VVFGSRVGRLRCLFECRRLCRIRRCLFRILTAPPARKASIVRFVGENRRLSLAAVFKIVSKLRAGVVWPNTYNKFDPTSPFGGYKERGFGREGGRHGLLPYVTLS
jgi:hypothetical protein